MTKDSIYIQYHAGGIQIWTPLENLSEIAELNYYKITNIERFSEDLVKFMKEDLTKEEIKSMFEDAITRMAIGGNEFIEQSQPEDEV